MHLRSLDPSGSHGSTATHSQLAHVLPPETLAKHFHSFPLGQKHPPAAHVPPASPHMSCSVLHTHPDTPSRHFMRDPQSHEHETLSHEPSSALVAMHTAAFSAEHSHEQSSGFIDAPVPQGDADEQSHMHLSGSQVPPLAHSRVDGHTHFFCPASQNVLLPAPEQSHAHLYLSHAPPVDVHPSSDPSSAHLS